MSITATKYINNSKLKTSYIGAYHYSRPVRSKQDMEVNIYGLLSVTSAVEIPGDKLAKFAWDGIVDGFEYSKSDSVNESLKISLNEATRRVKQLILNDTNIAQHGVDINFTIFVSSNGGIYIGVLGEADIFLYKKGRLVDIFEILEKKRAKTAGIAIEEKDLIFSSTKDVFKENITRLMSTKSREELVSVLEGLGNEVGDDKGILVLQKEKEEKVVLRKKVEKEVEIVKEEKIETRDSDYIPTTIDTPESKPEVNEKDLKMFFLDIKQKVLKIFTKVSVIFKPLKKIPFEKVGMFFKGIWKKIKEKLTTAFSRKRWFKKVSSEVTQSNILRKRKDVFKSFKIDGYKQKNVRFQRIKLLLLVVLGILLFFFGVKFTLAQKELMENSKVAKEVFLEVDDLLNSANSKISTDRDSSILSIYQVSEKLNGLPTILRDDDIKKVDEYRKQVLKIEDTLYKRVRLSTTDGNIEKYLDMLTLNGADSNPMDIAIYRDGNANEYLFLPDSGLKSVYRISLYDKEVKNLADDSKVLSNPSFIYTKASGVYVMDLTNGVLKATTDGSWYTSFSSLTGLSIEDIDAIDIAEFAVLTTVDNIYVLDRGSKALLKSSNYGSGYGLSSTYLENESFESGNDVFSDISVYILTQGQDGIKRYNSDLRVGGLVEAPLTIKGLEDNLKNPKYGYTADDLNKDLYIFDSEDKRILRFEKPMESGEIRHPNELLLVKQYVLPSDTNWDSVKDFVVDFKQEYLYILNGTMIWKVRL